MPKRIVTLNIEGTSLRILIAKGKRVEKWESVPLEPGLVKDGVISDPQALGLSLRKSLDSQGVKGRKVIFSISGLHFVPRLLTLPKLPRKMLGKAIQNEAKRIMPIPFEELYLYWQPISNRGKEQQIFLIGVPKNLVDAQVQVLQGAGIKSYLIELKPLALVRMAGRKDALIIDIEPGSFTIIVVTKGVPQIIRTIALSQGRVSREEIIRYLGDEIERTVKFYNSTHPRDPLPSIPLFFTGELADDPAIPKSVAAKTQLPLEPPKPPLSSPPDLSLHKYGVNIGLALREMRLPKAGRPQAIDFDILPEAYKLKRSNRQALLLFLILVGFVPLLPISQIPSSSTFSISFPSLYEMNISEVARTAALRHKLDVLNQKLQERIIENKEIAEIGTAIERTTIKAESLRRCLDDLATQRNNFLESMRSVTIKALTSGISLTSISESHGGIKLEGEAESFDAVLDYAQALRETERFYTVWVKSLGEKAENVVSFNIEVNE